MPKWEDKKHTQLPTDDDGAEYAQTIGQVYDSFKHVGHSPQETVLGVPLGFKENTGYRTLVVRGLRTYILNHLMEVWRFCLALISGQHVLWLIR